jgi:hypothetical protein
MMKPWIIPYIDQPVAFWHEIQDHYGDAIEEVYFPMPQGWFASGRSRLPETHLDTFLREGRLPKAVLVNPIILPEPIAEIAPRVAEKLMELYERFGVRSVTVTSLDLARHIRQTMPFMHITASCLMGISTPSQVAYLDSAVDSLTPDTRLSHDLPGLEKLKSTFGGRIRLLVNESCLPGCPLRTQHFYEMAYSKTFPHSLCQSLLEQSPWLRLTGGWILPQHLHYYDGVCDSWKLAGRVTLKDPLKYRQVLAAFMGRTPLRPADIGGGPASVLAPVEIPDRFFENILHCDKDCGRCSVCRDFYAAHTLA